MLAILARLRLGRPAPDSGDLGSIRGGSGKRFAITSPSVVDTFCWSASLALVALFASGNEIGRAYAECCGDAPHCPPARGRLARLGSRKRPGGDPGAVCEVFLC